MSEVITTVQEVKVVASGSNDRGAWTKSALVAADGNEYTTFDGGLASKAQALVGQAVKVTFEQTQRGKYTNYDLKDVEPAPAGATQAPAASSKSSEFRSKEEIRYTAALELAVTSFGVAGVDPVTKVPELYELADEFYTRLEQIYDQGGID